MAAKKKTAEVAPAAVPMSPAIKGFDANMQCRGFQFEAGKTYNHTGSVVACHSGFHVVTGHPLAVFGYYPPAGSRFCRVEVGGATHTDDNVKVAAEILKVGQELSLRDLTLEAVKWVIDRATLEGPIAVKANGLATASGDQGAATASGDRGAATASGTRGAATASGTDGQVMGAEGNALFACERGPYDGRGYPIVSVACGIVGKDGIEPDCWYRAVGGKLVKAGQ